MLLLECLGEIITFSAYGRLRVSALRMYTDRNLFCVGCCRLMLCCAVRVVQRGGRGVTSGGGSECSRFIEHVVVVVGEIIQTALIKYDTVPQHN